MVLVLSTTYLFDITQAETLPISTVWSKTYAEQSNIWIDCTIKTSDGGYVLAGGIDGYEGILIKVDSDGKFQWSKIISPENNIGGFFTSIIQTSEGGFAMSAGNMGNLGLCLLKTDSEGNVQWRKNYNDGETNYFANTVIQTMDGGYAVLGQKGDPIDAPARKAWLVKTDNNGNVEWTKNYKDTTFGPVEDSYLSSVIQNGDGSYVLVGYACNIYVWMVTTDSSGNLIHNRIFEENLEDSHEYHLFYAHSVIKTQDGGYALTTNHAYYSGCCLKRTRQVICNGIEFFK